MEKESLEATLEINGMATPEVAFEFERFMNEKVNSVVYDKFGLGIHLHVIPIASAKFTGSRLNKEDLWKLAKLFRQHQREIRPGRSGNTTGNMFGRQAERFVEFLGDSTYTIDTLREQVPYYADHLSDDRHYDIKTTVVNYTRMVKEFLNWIEKVTQRSTPSD